MAHGDRLSAKDITVTPAGAAFQFEGAWGTEVFAVTDTEVIFPDALNYTLIKASKTTRAYSSYINCNIIGDDGFEGAVSLAANQIILASGGSFYSNYILNTTTGLRVRTLGGGFTNGAIGLDGSNLYAADEQSRPNLVKVINVTSGNRVNSLEFSALQLRSVITIPQIKGIVIRNNLVTFFNDQGRGFSFDKTTKARMASMDITLGFSIPTYPSYSLDQIVSQNPGDAEFYAISAASNATFTLQAYEYNPDPATALDEIVRQSGGAATKKRYIHILRGGHTQTDKIYRGSDEIWAPGTVPSITSFTAAPTTIDLDTRATGNITLTFAVTNSTRNRITNARTGTNVPLTTSTTAIVAQPLEPTDYVLTCSNQHGSSSQRVSVGVTRNPQVNNLRRTGFRQSLHGNDAGTYRFGATIIGLPRPSLRYAFSVGGSGAISDRHLSPGSRPDTWNLDWTHYFGTNVPRRLTITATNSSGTASAAIANIQAG